MTAPQSIAVPVDLRGANRFVSSTRGAASGQRAGADGRIAIGPKRGVVYTVVSRDLLRRALLILQAVLGEAQLRGWEIEPCDGNGYGEHPGVAIVIGEHRYPVEIHEVTQTIPFSEEEIAAWRKEAWRREDRSDKTPPSQRKRKRATGRLALRLPHGYQGGRARWTEGVRGPLEAKLGSVFAALEERVIEDDRRAAEWARQAEIRRQEEIERAARAQAQRIEKARAERLVAEAGAWERSELVRRYLEALQAGLPELEPSERERLSTWCVWADGWAGRSDPVTSTQRIVGFDDERDARGW